MDKAQQKKQKFQLNDVPQIVTEKGITIEWCKGIEGKQVTIYHRKKGSHFADHYHTGSDSSKNPERFYLIKGKVRFDFFDIFTNKKEKLIVKAGQELLIFPFIYHKAESLEDSVFLEYKSEEFNPNQSDIHSLQEYEQLLSS